jgi:hypothetical protein
MSREYRKKRLAIRSSEAGEGENFEGEEDIITPYFFVEWEA